MILDTSAIVAVLTEEPDAPRILAALASADDVGIGAPTVVETGIVLTARLGAVGRSLLSRFLEESEAEVLAFTPEHWSRGVDAFSRFGKGRHRAGLNFGDCLTYAIAAVARRPLLCVGQDFAETDLSLVP
ncbi:MAG TPA: type II toxin-antitoxin system VapC family toxin [Gaiellales bacterium]|nr:type II toxin-antitoxin system VapC family toxin [Gaiellales bacterium]